MTLDHCTEGHLIAEEIAEAGYPALVGPAMLSRTKIELRNLSLETPAVLTRAGVKVAIVTDYNVLPLYTLPICAGLAVRAGLDEQDAWKAITINAAEITGVADRIGSLEPGKDADIAIFQGNPITTVTCRTRAVLIDGKIVYQNPVC